MFFLNASAPLGRIHCKKSSRFSRKHLQLSLQRGPPPPTSPQRTDAGPASLRLFGQSSQTPSLPLRGRSLASPLRPGDNADARLLEGSESSDTSPKWPRSLRNATASAPKSCFGINQPTQSETFKEETGSWQRSNVPPPLHTSLHLLDTCASQNLAGWWIYQRFNWCNVCLTGWRHTFKHSLYLNHCYERTVKKQSTCSSVSRLLGTVVLTNAVKRGLDSFETLHLHPADALVYGTQVAHRALLRLTTLNTSVLLRLPPKKEKREPVGTGRCFQNNP